MNKELIQKELERKELNMSKEKYLIQLKMELLRLEEIRKQNKINKSLNGRIITGKIPVSL